MFVSGSAYAKWRARKIWLKANLLQKVLSALKNLLRDAKIAIAVWRIGRFAWYFWKCNLACQELSLLFLSASRGIVCMSSLKDLEVILAMSVPPKLHNLSERGPCRGGHCGLDCEHCLLKKLKDRSILS